MSQADLEAHDERLKERLLSTEVGLLNTLANIASLFIAAASLLAMLSPCVPRSYFLAIILLCTTVIACVLFDFRFYRRSYGSMAFSPKAALSDPSVAQEYLDELARQKARVRESRRWKKRREKLAYACLAIVVALFILVIWRF